MADYDDLDSMSDEELERRIMLRLKQACDVTGSPYPWKLIAYLERKGRANG